jgi:pimeloyl-ACP methyl ester carboxylesterase
MLLTVAAATVEDMEKHTASSIILVPGHWLGAWAWDDVAARLTDLGHAVEAVTLRGSSSPDEPQVSLTDQADDLETVIARLATPPVLVAHSGAGRVATAVLDRRPDAVRRVVYVDSGPAADGSAFDDSVADDVASIPLPSWEELEAGGASLDGLDDQRLATFRTRAVPVPGDVARERLQLRDERRLDVPTTIIACSLPSAQMLELARGGHPMFAEVSRLRDLELVDLPTGHWPMWSRPADLANAVAAAGQAG